MSIEIKFRKTIDNDTFYELYIDGIRVCGFYDLFVIFVRLHKYMKGDNNFYLVDAYERKLLNA